jgi:hypothetical protein
MAYAAGWAFIALRRPHHLRRARAALPRLLSSQATTELSGYALAFGIAWALAHTLSSRAHVRIDVLVNLFAARRCATPMHLTEPGLHSPSSSASSF